MSDIASCKWCQNQTKINLKQNMDDLEEFGIVK